MAGIESAKKRCREEDKPPVISTVNPSVVLTNVLNQLGKPKDLSAFGGCLTRATPITQKSFRVMIYRDTPSPTLTDTFFVNVNNEGGILRSSPAIVAKYRDN